MTDFSAVLISQNGGFLMTPDETGCSAKCIYTVYVRNNMCMCV